MSLKEFLLVSGVDQIEDDQQFMETEYSLIQEYYEKYGFTQQDLETINRRGIEWG